MDLCGRFEPKRLLEWRLATFCRFDGLRRSNPTSVPGIYWNGAALRAGVATAA